MHQEGIYLTLDSLKVQNERNDKTLMAKHSINITLAGYLSTCRRLVHVIGTGPSDASEGCFISKLHPQVIRMGSLGCLC